MYSRLGIPSDECKENKYLNQSVDALGRKWSIMTAAFIFTVGGVFQIIGLDLGMLYAGRVISGLGVGALSMLVPVRIYNDLHTIRRHLYPPLDLRGGNIASESTRQVGWVMDVLYCNRTSYLVLVKLYCTQTHRRTQKHVMAYPAHHPSHPLHLALLWHDGLI